MTRADYRASLRGRRCYVWMDLASTKDLTALVAVQDGNLSDVRLWSPMMATDVLRMIRQDEQLALDALSGSSTPRDLAVTHVPIARAVFALVDHPPTRHHEFVIRTIWNYRERTALRHAVAVKQRGRLPYRLVREYRAGLFGEEGAR